MQTLEDLKHLQHVSDYKINFYFIITSAENAASYKYIIQNGRRMFRIVSEIGNSNLIPNCSSFNFFKNQTEVSNSNHKFILILFLYVILLFYCSNKTPWPRQLMKESIWLGLLFHQYWYMPLIPALGRQTGELLWVQGQADLNNEYQDSQDYKVRPLRISRKGPNLKKLK